MSDITAPLLNNPEREHYHSNGQSPLMSYDFVQSHWTLYYSPEGFPYYYNSLTGESIWAEMNTSETGKFESDVYAHKSREESAADDDSSDDEDENDYTSGVVKVSSSSQRDLFKLKSDTGAFANKEMEIKFRAFLETPEGKEALKAEQQHIQERVNKKITRRSKLLSQQSGKKKKNVSALSSTLWSWFGPNWSNTDDSSDSDNSVDDEDVEARLVTKKKMSMDNKNKITMPSPLSIDDDDDSVSSDDSDVQQLTSPYIPEWLSPRLPDSDSSSRDNSNNSITLDNIDVDLDHDIDAPENSSRRYVTEQLVNTNTTSRTVGTWTWTTLTWMLEVSGYGVTNIYSRMNNAVLNWVTLQSSSSSSSSPFSPPCISVNTMTSSNIPSLPSALSPTSHTRNSDKI